MTKSSFIVLMLLAVTCVFALNAQPNNTATLPLLIGRLPLMSPTERLDLGPFTEAFEAAYKRDPASLDSTVKGLQANLDSTDPWIQRTTAVLIFSLAGESNNPKFVLRFTDQLAKLITSNDEYASGSAIYAVSILGESTPDNVVQSLLTALKDKNSPDRVYMSAVPVLLVARPNNAQVEGAVLSAISDQTRTEDQRCQLLLATGGASRLAGQAVVDYVVSVVNTSPDIDLRDAGVSAAERIGLRALNPVVSKIQAIAGDPNESAESRERATHALKMQAHSVR